MSKFKVEVSKRAVMKATLEVEASSFEEARQIAEDIMRGEHGTSLVTQEETAKSVECGTDISWGYDHLDNESCAKIQKIVPS